MLGHKEGRSYNTCLGSRNLAKMAMQLGKTSEPSNQRVPMYPTRVRPIEIFSISADTDNLQIINADYLQIQIICRYGFIGRYQNYLPIFLNLQILLAGITDNICRYGLYLQIWTHICRYCRYTDMPIWKNYICYLQIYIGKLICRYYRQISLSVVL